MLGFQDNEKVGEISNVVLPLTIAASIANHTIFDLIVHDGSSYNIMYIDTLMKLGFHQDLWNLILHAICL